MGPNPAKIQPRTTNGKGVRTAKEYERQWSQTDPYDGAVGSNGEECHL